MIMVTAGLQDLFSTDAPPPLDASSEPHNLPSGVPARAPERRALRVWRTVGVFTGIARRRRERRRRDANGRDVSWQVYSLDEGDVLAVGMERSIDALEARLELDRDPPVRRPRRAPLGVISATWTRSASPPPAPESSHSPRTGSCSHWTGVTGGCGGGVSGSRGAPSESACTATTSSQRGRAEMWSATDRGRLLSLRRGRAATCGCRRRRARAAGARARGRRTARRARRVRRERARARGDLGGAERHEPGSRQRLPADARAGWRNAVVRDARTGRLLGQRLREPLERDARSMGARYAASAWCGPPLLRVSAHGPDDPVGGVRWSAHVLDGAAEPILEASARGVLVRAAGRATYLSAAGATLWSRQEPGAECIWWDASASRALVTCLDGGERVLRFLHPLGRVD